MKKTIAISLSIITIIISGWLIINRFNYIDIVSNKNDAYASQQKQKIDKRTDINACEKDILKNTIDLNRKENKQISAIAYQTQIVAFTIITIQIVLLIIILMMPKKVNELPRGRAIEVSSGKIFILIDENLRFSNFPLNPEAEPRGIL